MNRIIKIFRLSIIVIPLFSFGINNEQWTDLFNKTWRIMNHQHFDVIVSFVEDSYGYPRAVVQYGGSGVYATDNVLYNLSLKDDLIVLKNGIFIDDFFRASYTNNNDYRSRSSKYMDMNLTKNINKAHKLSNTYGIRLMEDPILLLDWWRRDVDLEKLKLYIETLPFEKEKLLINDFNKAKE